MTNAASPRIICAGCGAETSIREPVCARCACVMFHQVAPQPDYRVECRSMGCGWEGPESALKGQRCPVCGSVTEVVDLDGGVA